MAQPAPPSNPFDGFDTFGTVAQQPPPQQQQQQHQQQYPPQPHQQPVPPNQWGQQPTQQPVAQEHPVTAANPFGSVVNGNANPLVAAFHHGQGGFAQQPAQQQPVARMAAQPQQQQLQQQQQLGLGYAQQPQQPPPQVPPQQQQQHQHQLVALAPNAIVQSPWALQPMQQPAVGAGAIVPAASPAGGQSYDPFGVFGAPPHQQQLQLHQVQHNPYALGPHQQQAAAQTLTTTDKLQNEMQHFNLGGVQNTSLLPEEEEDEALALIDVELDDDSAENLEERKRDGEFLSSNRDVTGKKQPKSRGTPAKKQHNSWDRNPDIAPPPRLTPGRRHSEYLAANSAPVLSSPLPKPELVHHSGYVLSRISFRTVLMRKWKQTFWIQYGPTQLLFFRTFADYEDWLNNPYHTMKARNFLVKLRVDFVSDLKKASVMGYQVTQVRRKPYGKKVMLHFKLERWMDYGPTIAAAFAAREDEMMNSPRNGDRTADGGMNTVNDVASLRKIILGCMRNARDAASAVVASRANPSDNEEARMRGRYDAERQREVHVPASSGNMGYHQAFGAERGDRRPVGGEDQLSDVGTEESQDELENKNAAAVAEAPAPVVDLLG